MDEKRFAGLQVGATVEAEPSRLEDEREGGGLIKAHLVWYWRDGAGRSIRDFPVSASGEACVVDEGHHSIAGLKLRPGRCADHDTTHLGARHKGEARLGLVLPRNHR